MLLALPSPSGSPTTSLVPTSRMISSAIDSASLKTFGINFGPGDLGNPGLNRAFPIAHLELILVCDEGATAGNRVAGARCFNVAEERLMQLRIAGASAGAGGRGWFDD